MLSSRPLGHFSLSLFEKTRKILPNKVQRDDEKSFILGFICYLDASGSLSFFSKRKFKKNVTHKKVSESKISNKKNN